MIPTSLHSQRRRLWYLLLLATALFSFMPADRESESAGNENRLRIHCPMFTNWGKGRKVYRRLLPLAAVLLVCMLADRKAIVCFFSLLLSPFISHGLGA